MSKRDGVIFGFHCAICGHGRKPLTDWFVCGEYRMCSIECAVVFLLNAEAARDRGPE